MPGLVPALLEPDMWESREAKAHREKCAAHPVTSPETLNPKDLQGLRRAEPTAQTAVPVPTQPQRLQRYDPAADRLRPQHPYSLTL